MIVSGEILEKKLVKIPFRMIISGSTGTGKTQFCKRFLTSKLVERPQKIYYFFNDFYESSPEVWEIKKVPFHAYPGLPNEEFFQSIEPKSVVIVDDQFSACIQSKGLDIF